MNDSRNVFIAVMGTTGAGKSTFIKVASGDDTVGIGHTLKSFTSELRGYKFFYRGYNITLVDSPGFDDTYRKETEVLREIANWLKKTYEEDTKLSGIVYLHPIKNERMVGSALRNLKMFRELCGDEPLRNVVLATSFWDQVERRVGESRETELAQTPEFWGRMIQRGSRIERFGNRDSAMSIIMSLVNNTPRTLSIQHELVEQGKPLIETSAGKVVDEELARLKAEHQREREEIQRDYQEALRTRDEELQIILKEERERMDKELIRLQRQQQLLKDERRVHQRQLHNKIDALESRIDLSRSPGPIENNLSVGRNRLQLPNDQQELDLDWVISVLRAREAELKPEERIVVELKIEEVSKKKQGPAKLQKKKLGRYLLQSLRIVLPVTTMALLGFPIHFPFGSSSSSDTADVNDTRQ